MVEVGRIELGRVSLGQGHLGRVVQWVRRERDVGLDRCLTERWLRRDGVGRSGWGAGSGA